MNLGIDYGNGLTNIDHETGIRFGVISQHSMGEGFFDVFEPEYGEPHCPYCGDEAVSFDSDDHDGFETSQTFCSDYACERCGHSLSSDESFPEDAISHSINDGEYKAINCLDSDVMILESPFYTFGLFCSPCVPGGVSIEPSGVTNDHDVFGPEDGAPKAYCFGHDWFDGGKAPYRVFRVSDDSEVFPEVQS